MILSGKEIKKHIGNNIIIEPYNEAQLNPNSYNVRLDNKIIFYKQDKLDMKKNNEYIELTIPNDGFIIRPGALYLGRTLEYTETKCFVPMLEGRSSVGRLGIFIHITAGFGDVGFAGYWTLEISCIQPVKIYPFVEIGQIFYQEIKGEYDQYKSNKYQNNTGIQPSMMWKDFL